jgi:hypothetical protein
MKALTLFVQVTVAESRDSMHRHDGVKESLIFMKI